MNEYVLHQEVVVSEDEPKWPKQTSEHTDNETCKLTVALAWQKPGRYLLNFSLEATC